MKAKPGMTGAAQIASRHKEALSNPETLEDEYVSFILAPNLAMDMK